MNLLEPFLMGQFDVQSRNFISLYPGTVIQESLAVCPSLQPLGGVHRKTKENFADTRGKWMLWQARQIKGTLCRNFSKHTSVYLCGPQSGHRFPFHTEYSPCSLDIKFISL